MTVAKYRNNSNRTVKKQKKYELRKKYRNCFAPGTRLIQGCSEMGTRGTLCALCPWCGLNVGCLLNAVIHLEGKVRREDAIPLFFHKGDACHHYFNKIHVKRMFTVSAGGIIVFKTFLVQAYAFVLCLSVYCVYFIYSSRATFLT